MKTFKQVVDTPELTPYTDGSCGKRQQICDVTAGERSDDCRRRGAQEKWILDTQSATVMDKDKAPQHGHMLQNPDAALGGS